MFVDILLKALRRNNAVSQKGCHVCLAAVEAEASRKKRLAEAKEQLLEAKDAINSSKRSHIARRPPSLPSWRKYSQNELRKVAEGIDEWLEAGHSQKWKNSRAKINMLDWKQPEFRSKGDAC
jgi:hypothetical protein